MKRHPNRISILIYGKPTTTTTEVKWKRLQSNRIINNTFGQTLTVMANFYYHLHQLTTTFHEHSNFTNFYQVLTSHPDNPIVLAKQGNKFKIEGGIQRYQGIYYGVFCLIQSNGVPPKAKFGVAPEPVFPEDDNEGGLGHYTSFFFDAENNMLGIQRNKNGISINGLTEYFARNSSEAKRIEHGLVFDPEKLAEIGRFDRITKFTVDIAKIQNGSHFASNKDKTSVREVTKAADDTDANTLTLTFGVGYFRKASLIKARIRNIARQFIQRKDDFEIRKLEIHGSVDEDPIEVVDLITNKIEIVSSVQIRKTLTDDQVKTAVKRAIDSYINEFKDNLADYKVRVKN